MLKFSKAKIGAVKNKIFPTISNMAFAHQASIGLLNQG